MLFGPYTLTRIRTLQPPIQPLATRLMELAAEQDIPVEMVQAHRTPEEQTRLYEQGRTAQGQPVTYAPSLLSYHNYGLAFDLVPTAYLNLKDWNPTGPLWRKLGGLGEELGLTWGGRWRMPDRPHFELRAAPLTELKAYWQKFHKVMPITITPTITTLAIIALIGAAWAYWLQPTLQRSRLL